MYYYSTIIVLSYTTSDGTNSKNDSVHSLHVDGAVFYFESCDDAIGMLTTNEHFSPSWEDPVWTPSKSN